MKNVGAPAVADASRPGGMGLGRADQHPTLLEARVET